MKLKIIVFIILLFTIQYVSASYQISITEKENINNILENKIFSKYSKNKVDIFKKEIDNIFTSKKLTNKQQIILKYIKEVFDKKYKSKFVENFKIGEKQIFFLQNNLKNIKINIPTLMFHYIEDVPKSTSDKMRYSLSFSPEKLEKLLIYLQENNIETLTFFDLKDILEGKKDFSKKSIIISFDDGHLDHYTQAFPLLKKYNKKGVFFIISSKPNNDWNHMNWEQIKEISENGNEIASHTISHSDLTKLTLTEQKKEIFDSKNTIEKHIKKPIISFSYPYGKNNKEIIKLVKTKYLFARNTKNGKYFFTNNLYSIPTIHMTPKFSLKEIQGVYGK